MFTSIEAVESEPIMGKLGAALLIVILGLGLHPAHAAEPLSQEAVASAVDAAFNEIIAGQPARAIKRVEPVIARFDAMQANNPHACAQTSDQAETLVILENGKSDRKLTIVGIDYCSAYFIKGFALIDLKRPDEALPWLQIAHDRAPLHAHFTNELAEWHKAHREWQRAYDLFREASNSADEASEQSRNSYKARALRGMGFTKIETGDLNEAEALFNASLKLEPDSNAAKNELEYIRGLRGTPNT